jgi:hypothetical protein
VAVAYNIKYYHLPTYYRSYSVGNDKRRKITFTYYDNSVATKHAGPDLNLIEVYQTTIPIRMNTFAIAIVTGFGLVLTSIVAENSAYSAYCIRSL